MQGCDTVFVTPTARTIDIAHAWIMVVPPLCIFLCIEFPAMCQTINGTHILFSEKCNNIGDLTRDKRENNINA